METVTSFYVRQPEDTFEGRNWIVQQWMKAIDQWKAATLRNVFRVWLRSASLLQNARHFRKTNLTTKAFNRIINVNKKQPIKRIQIRYFTKWQRRVVSRRKLNLRLIRSQKRHEISSTRRFFLIWHNALEKKIVRRKNQSDAQSYNQSKRVARIFYSWQNAHRTAEQMRTAKNTLCFRTFSTSFYIWSKKAGTSIGLRMSLKQHEQNLKKRSLLTWKESAETCANNKLSALMLLRYNVEYHSFILWKHRVIKLRRATFQTIILQFKQRNSKRLLTSMFQAWKVAVARIGLRNSIASTTDDNRRVQLYFVTWHRRTHDLTASSTLRRILLARATFKKMKEVCERLKVVVTESLHLEITNLMTHAFQRWQLACYKRILLRQMIADYSAKKSAATVQSYFAVWSRLGQRISSMKRIAASYGYKNTMMVSMTCWKAVVAKFAAQKSASVIHHRQIILTFAFQHWQVSCYRSILLSRQAKSFDASRRKLSYRTCMDIWKSRAVAKGELNAVASLYNVKRTLLRLKQGLLKIRTSQKKAVLFYKQSLLTDTHNLWLIKYYRKVLLRKRTTDFAVVKRSSMLQLTFSLWKQLLGTFKGLVNAANSHHTVQLAKDSFRRFRLIMAKLGSLKQLADEYRNKTLLSGWLQEWQIIYYKRVLLLRRLKDYLLAKDATVIAKYTYAWRLRWVRMRNIYTAEAKFETQRKAKYFSKWNAKFEQVFQSKLNNKLRALKGAVKEWQLERLRSTFIQWRILSRLKAWERGRTLNTKAQVFQFWKKGTLIKVTGHRNTDLRLAKSKVAIFKRWRNEASWRIERRKNMKLRSLKSVVDDWRLSKVRDVFAHWRRATISASWERRTRLKNSITFWKKRFSRLKLRKCMKVWINRQYKLERTLA
jgi:hypothetical protein